MLWVGRSSGYWRADVPIHSVEYAAKTRSPLSSSRHGRRLKTPIAEAPGFPFPSLPDVLALRLALAEIQQISRAPARTKSYQSSPPAVGVGSRRTDRSALSSRRFFRPVRPTHMLTALPVSWATSRRRRTEGGRPPWTYHPRRPVKTSTPMPLLTRRMRASIQLRVGRG